MIALIRHLPRFRQEAFLFTVATLLWGCAGVPVPQPPAGTGPDRAPTVSRADLVRLSQLPNPTVTALQKSATGNGPEYVVWGKTYNVQPSAEGYREEGISSWYGAKFHGRRTSSGEPFDMYQLTAAHRSLPIPVFARVTNLRNGLSTIVKINDRGPFHEDRIIDLSYAAAVKLDFHNSGTSRVRVEALTEAASAKDGRPNEDSYYLHAGRFETAEQARQALQNLIAVEPLSALIIARGESGFGLRLGPFTAAFERQRFEALLIALDIGLPTLVPER